MARKRRTVSEGYKCRTCGKEHKGMPLSFAAEFPDMYANLKREDRDARAIIGSDQCIIDHEWFFVRGCLEIPILGSDEIFLWGVWASVREEAFDEISECWELEGREKTHGPFKGRLANSLSVYPPTPNLKLRIVMQPVGTRPLFVIEEEHPLATEQRGGISRDRAMDLAALLLHQERGGFPSFPQQSTGIT
jgi:hypothetical protein